MTRKNLALLAVLIAAGIVILVGVRFARPTPADDDVAAAAAPDARPSPVAESVDMVIRPRREPAKAAPESKPLPEVQRARSAGDGIKEWSVIAATLGSVDAAQKRAASLKAAWRDCACTVFPTGASDHYYVIVGTDLDRDSADSLRDRAKSAGLPGDTYVTKLIRRPGDEAP